MKSSMWVALLAFAASWGQPAGFELARSKVDDPVQLAAAGDHLPDEQTEEKKDTTTTFDPYHHSNYKEETHIAGGVTAECFFAFIYVMILGSVPLILLGLVGGKELTRAHVIECVSLVVWLVMAIHLFCNVLTFNSGSGHWVGARSLTIAEAVYLLSQILTTVGYGDMTPATPFSQVWVAVNVILALCLYGSLISEAAALFMDKAYVKMKQKLDSYYGVPAPEEEEGAPSAASEASRLEQEAQKPLKDWGDVAPPNVDYQNLFVWMGAFSVSVFFGVMFWHYYPGENKTWLQAVYFSVITLSTVGFGAITAVTPGGFVFGAFWMLFGVATLAGAVGSFVEIMFMFKAYQRLNPDLSKLQFFRYVQNCGKQIPAFGDLGFEKYEFVKFGVLLNELATEDEVKVLEKHFEALAGEDGKISKEKIIEFQAPAGYKDE